MPPDLLTPTVPPPPGETPYPTDLMSDDGEPLETPYHRAIIGLLIETITVHRRGQTDYYAGGNMFVYYSAEQARNRDYKGPDFFVVEGVPKDPPRLYWAIWKENFRYPDVIVELTSSSTEKTDRTTKFRLYEQTFRTREYFLYDPETHALEGWRLSNGEYVSIEPDRQGQLWSEVLGLFLGRWEGCYQEIGSGMLLRFFDAKGRLVPTFGEEARALADEQQRRADEEKRRADEQQRRAESSEAEAQRLRRELEQAKKPRRRKK